MGNIKASSTGSGVDHYTYTYTVSGDSTIAVTIGGGSVETDTLHVKQNGTWKKVAKAYKKTNGTWTEIDPADAFQSGVKLVLGQ